MQTSRVLVSTSLRCVLALRKARSGAFVADVLVHSSFGPSAPGRVGGFRSQMSVQGLSVEACRLPSPSSFSSSVFRFPFTAVAASHSFHPRRTGPVLVSA